MRHWIELLVILSIQFGNIKFTNGQMKPEVLGSPDAIVYDMRLIQEKEFVIANLADKIELWNYQTKVLINSWSTSQIVAIDYLNNKLVGVSKSGNIVIWNIPDGKETLQLKVTAAPLICVAWIDSVFLAVGSDNGDIMKVNSGSGEIMSKVSNRTAITAMAIGQNNILITGDAKGTIASYDTKEMRLESTVRGHHSWIREIKFSTDGQFFVTISDDGRYRKWRSGKEIKSISNESLGNWLLCTDFLNSSESAFDIMAFGKRNGGITVVTRFANYTSDINSTINSIGIIRKELPAIVLVLGTHGAGIQLLNAKAMKLKTK